MPIDRSKIDFGVLDPQTTEVVEYVSPEGRPNHHVMLFGRQEPPWPYPPEVVQRRNNNFHAGLCVTFIVNPEEPWDLAATGIAANPNSGFSGVLFELCVQGFLDPHDLKNQIHLFLMKMLRPAAPKGVEWNAPGGVLNLREDSQQGMLREFAEEVKGMKVLGSSMLFHNLQFTSGVYRELYDIGIALAYGQPSFGEDEGGLEFKTVPLRQALHWAMTQNEVPLESPAYCGVDGKIIMALQKMSDIIENVQFDVAVHQGHTTRD